MFSCKLESQFRSLSHTEPRVHNYDKGNRAAVLECELAETQGARTKMTGKTNENVNPRFVGYT
jgi:hypothetical protein